jgi:hypothetical protein
VQLDPGLLKVSVGTEEVKDTIPVGVAVAPAEVSATVAVTVTGCPTTAVALENETEVEVETALTVRIALAAEPLWTGVPAKVPVIVSVPLDGGVTVTWQLD